MSPSLPLILAVSPVLGSFVTTAGIRHAADEGVLRGRSYCDRCGKALGYRETIPIWSYLAQRGHCLHCDGPISWVYPTGELLGAAVVIVPIFLFPIGYAAIVGAIGLVLLYLSIVDLRTLRVSVLGLLTVALLGLCATFLEDGSTTNVVPSVILASVLWLLLAAVAVVGKSLRGRTVLGWGDVHLVGGLSLWLRDFAPLALLAASALALLVALAADSKARRIPFVPYLAFAGWVIGVGATSMHLGD